jgi:hypothetical protein
MAQHGLRELARNSNVSLEELRNLVTQPGVKLTGGGDGYNPSARENQWELRYDNAGNAYNARITVPMMRGHSRDPENVVPISELRTPVAAAKKHSRSIDENLYNRQGRANYKSQDTDNSEIIRGDPELGSLPALDQRAYAEEAYYTEELERDAHDEEAYYDEQDKQALLKAQEAREDNRAEWDMRRAADQFSKLDGDWEDRNALRVLQNLRLKEVEAKRQEEFAPAEFNPEEFSRRVADVPTPSWLGQSENLMSDATRASDTDDFGNLLSTDAFGQTNYEVGVDQRLNALNSQYGGINYEKPVPTQPVVKQSVQSDSKSNYPGHFTPWMIEQLEGQRKRKEFMQGIGKTASDITGDITESFNAWRDKVFN